MGQKYLIDTNAIIDYLDGKLPISGMAFMNNVVDVIPNVSIITKIEVLGYNHTEIRSTFLQEFISFSNVFELNEDVVNATIALRKIRRIKTPDAIIASTAITYNLILITRDIADFANIKNLKLIDPYTK